MAPEPTESGNGLWVGYSVKELLALIHVRLTAIEEKLEDKVGMAEVYDLRRRIDSLERWRAYVAGVACLALVVASFATRNYF